jgi:hypothetical protein
MHLNKNEVFAALEKIDEGLVLFPQEKVLLQFRESILKLQINSTKSP